jgi:mannosyltransferase
VLTGRKRALLKFRGSGNSAGMASLSILPAADLVLARPWRGRRRSSSHYDWPVNRLSKSSAAAGLLAFVYSGNGIWRPSFWTDEAATLSAVRRDLPDLAAMLGNIDAVHGAYYFLMFGWTRIFGFSELAVRLPSLMAVSLAALMMVELGRKLSSVHLGLMAAAVFVLMPRSQYAATDARSYALTVLGGVVASYLLVSLRDDPRAVKWVMYAATGFLTVSLSFYCALLFIAHALTCTWDMKLRTMWRSMLISSLAWLAPALYIGSIASRQQFQISWIPPVGPSFPFEVAFLQFFGDGYFAKDGQVSPLHTPGEDLSMFALEGLVWTAAAVGILVNRRRFLVKLGVPWLVVPLVAAVGGSLVTGGNYYLPRYLTFEIPALALLAAAPAAVHFAPAGPKIRAMMFGFVAAALMVTLPSYLGQRTQYGRDTHDDFRYIAKSVKKLGSPGDAFVMGPGSDLAYQAYPESFEGLADPTRGISATEWKRIYNQRFDVVSAASRILVHPTVILVEETGDQSMSAALEQLGYEFRESERGPSTTVTKYVLK